MKYLIIIYLLILSASCRSPQVVTETYTKDSTIIREIPRIITLPGEKVKTPSINLDSLVTMIQAGIKPEVITNTLTYTDPETNMRVGLLLDELGNLSALCESQEKTIEIMEKEIERFRHEVATTTITERPPFFQRLRQSIFFLFLGVAMAIISFAIILRR